MCVRLCNLREGFLVLDFAGPQEPEHIFGPLCHSMFHPVVMPQLFNTQLHPTEVLVTCSVGMDNWHYFIRVYDLYSVILSTVWACQVHVETSVSCFGISLFQGTPGIVRYVNVLMHVILYTSQTKKTLAVPGGRWAALSVPQWSNNNNITNTYFEMDFSILYLKWDRAMTNPLWYCCDFTDI